MKNKLVFILLLIFFQHSYASPEQAPLSVWVNEAIVATYSYGYKNYLEDQKKIAKYFTTDGWIAYSNALNASKLPDAVQKNLYQLSAVATQPPIITNLDPTHWKATMNLLVIYQNPQYQQRQNLKVAISFMQAPSGQGVRGYSITSLHATAIKPPCQCAVEKENAQPPAANPSDTKS